MELREDNSRMQYCPYEMFINSDGNRKKENIYVKNIDSKWNIEIIFGYHYSKSSLKQKTNNDII